MSRAQVATRHYARIFSLWPKDPLRPQQAFQSVLEKRSNGAGSSASSAAGSAAVNGADEMRSVNALYSLLDNRYMKKYPTPPHVLAPQSNPDHYNNLIAELEVAPTRNWLQTWVAKMKGKVRFS